MVVGKNNEHKNFIVRSNTTSDVKLLQSSRWQANNKGPNEVYQYQIENQIEQREKYRERQREYARIYRLKKRQEKIEKYNQERLKLHEWKQISKNFREILIGDNTIIETQSNVAENEPSIGSRTAEVVEQVSVETQSNNVAENEPSIGTRTAEVAQQVSVETQNMERSEALSAAKGAGCKRIEQRLESVDDCRKSCVAQQIDIDTHSNNNNNNNNNNNINLNIGGINIRISSSSNISISISETHSRVVSGVPSLQQVV